MMVDCGTEYNRTDQWHRVYTFTGSTGAAYPAPGWYSRSVMPSSVSSGY